MRSSVLQLVPALTVVGVAWLVTTAAVAEPPAPAPTLRAQAKQGDTAGADKKRSEVEARLKALRADVLRKRVGLDPQKATEVERILERNSPERSKLQAKLRSHRRALQRLLTQDSNDQQAYAQAIQGLREAQGELQKLRLREMDEIAKHLTPKQQAKLAAALRQLNKGLKRHLRDYAQQ